MKMIGDNDQPISNGDKHTKNYLTVPKKQYFLIFTVIGLSALLYYASIESTARNQTVVSMERLALLDKIVQSIEIIAQHSNDETTKLEQIYQQLILNGKKMDDILAKLQD